MPGTSDAAPRNDVPIHPGRPFLVGLTGGIGSGKSTVASFLEGLGAFVIDADIIAHQLTAAGGAAMERIRCEFGSEALNEFGALERGHMRKLVFGDAGVKRRLEAILHPQVREEIGRALETAAPAISRSNEESGYAVLVIPLMLETGAYADMVNRIAVVDCPEARQISRVVKRSALPVGEIRQIIAAQAPRCLRLQLADDVLCNVGTKDALEASARILHARYVTLSRHSRGMGR